jgi:nucleoid-associated protein YgaU
MKPVTALAVIVVIFLVILGIAFWQLGIFKPSETITPLTEAVTPTDLAGITFTGLAGVPTNSDSISSTGGLDQFYNPMTPVQPTSTSYTVKPGDTLWIIAQHFYNGDGTKWKMIQDANKIQNPSKLKAGMVLTIPDASDTSYRTTAPVATDTTAGTYTPSTTTGGKYHTVVKGDTLWKLARKYYNDSTKTDLILDANRDKMTTRETTLKPGWKLLIPDAPKKESKPKSSSKKTTPKTTTKTPPPVTTTTPPPANPTTGGDNTPTGVGD